MKQKYLISRNNDTGYLTIQEFAELDRELFSLICEEAYDGKTIERAVKEGKKALISAIRTPNMYPIAEYIDRIADAVIEIGQKNSEPGQTRELEFDDSAFMKKREDKPAESEEDSVEIDDLLEEDENADVDEDADDSLDAPDNDADD